MRQPLHLLPIAALALVLCWPGYSLAQAQASAAQAAEAELAVSDRIDALAKAGHTREALAAADTFIAQGSAGGYVRAQRGFLRRELGDLAGAADDFAEALASEGLSPEQVRNVQAALTEARAAQAQSWLVNAQSDFDNGDFAAAAGGANRVLDREANSAPAMLLRVEALNGEGEKPQALAAAYQYLRILPTHAGLLAQRGYLRRAANDLLGAADDFAAALAANSLSDEQQRNVKAAFVEAQDAQRQIVEAETAKRKAAEAELESRKAAEEAARQRAEAQARARVQVDADTLIARGHAPGWACAQRGLARRKAGNLKGAIADFAAALKTRDLDAKATSEVRYARAEAVAALAEKNGKPLMAEASYRELLRDEPKQADAWYKLGYLLLKQKQRKAGADALSKGLEIKPVATAYLDAANAYILSDAPLASREYRQGLDRWYAGDKSVTKRSQTDLEHIKNEVVQADASIQTSASLGGMAGRPDSAGGSNNAAGAETRLRFDGRYLPAAPGLEAFMQGLTDKDANGERETDAGAGLHYRPIPDLNLYFGGMLDQFFKPQPETEFTGVWGLGLGADAYPFVGGFKPYWDFGTFGSWRTRDKRVLEDVHGNFGALYEARSPFRAAVGPTLLAVAGYDSKATTQWAAGVGPSLLSYIWLGGDEYRSYDAVVTVQLGYIFSVGPDQRQRGWRGTISVTF